MDAIALRISEQIKTVISEWDTVDTVGMLKFGSDRYDPSFFISFDVYFHGAIPASNERERAFSFGNAYETTVDGLKDRFLIDDVPVRLEYKAISEVDFAVSKVTNPERGDTLGTTYGFYRLEHAAVVLSRSNWLPVARRLLSEAPEDFWVRRVHMLRAQMEHALSDLTSAVYGDEPLFYALSLARFLETATSLLFAFNRRFDPPGRLVRHEVAALERLPEEFESRMEHLLRQDAGVSASRKRQIAELLAKSLLRMS